MIAKQIRKPSAHPGHVPIIDSNPRSGKAELIREKKARRAAGFVQPEQGRYKERSTVGRAFGRLKDEIGGRPVRVCGHEKVACHLMFASLALTADQLMRLLHCRRASTPGFADSRLSAEAGIREGCVRKAAIEPAGHHRETDQVSGNPLSRTQTPTTLQSLMLSGPTAKIHAPGSLISTRALNSFAASIISLALKRSGFFRQSTQPCRPRGLPNDDGALPPAR